jgi:hypothetical protein
VSVPAVPELTSPLALGAVALLAANDHLLKRRWPGPVTGKLSDVAGCFVLPLFVSAVLALATRWTPRRRLAVGAAVTAIFFSALKLSPAAAGGVARAIDALWAPLGRGGGRIVADPADLVALPFALLAFAWGARLHARRTGGAR